MLDLYFVSITKMIWLQVTEFFPTVVKTDKNLFILQNLKEDQRLANAAVLSAAE